MRFLLLLLPNLYDVFTLLMIGYAFILKNNSQLQIPFVTACLLIYATTRIGLIAGELINKIFNNPAVSEEQEIEEPAEAVAKRMFMGIIPPCIAIIVCQVIFALFFLQNPSHLQNSAVENQLSNSQEQTQQENLENRNSAEISENVSTTSSIEQTQNEEDDEEIIQPQVSPKQTVKPQAKTGKKTVSQKAAKTKTVTNQVSAYQPQNNVYYEIPHKTLRAAGISPESRQQSVQSQNVSQKTIVPVQNNNSWTFTASKTNQIAVSNTTYETKKPQQPVSSLKPKRYPGDDNPLNANWGYYKYTETKPVSSTTAPKQQAKPAANIPANTLRSIGY